MNIPVKPTPQRKNLKSLLIAGAVILLVVLTAFVKGLAAENRASAVDSETQLEQARTAGQPVLVFFHSPDCHSCLVVKNSIDAIYPEFQDRVVLLDVDVTEPDSGSLVKRTGVHSTPTLLFYNTSGGEKTLVGEISPADLRVELDNPGGRPAIDIDPSLLQPASLLGYLLVFLGGVVTSIGPCNVAMIPLIVGFIGGSHDLPRRRAFWISFVFSLGLAVTFMLLGVTASLLGGLLGGGTRVWYYIVAAVCFIIGLQMMDVIHIPAPVWLSSLQQKITRRGLWGAFLLGLVSGLVASQCATPVLAVILTYVMAQKSSLLYGAALLFLYALGRAVPILLAGTFTGVLKNLRAFGKWSGRIEKISGGVLLLVGAYFLWVA